MQTICEAYAKTTTIDGEPGNTGTSSSRAQNAVIGGKDIDWILRGIGVKEAAVLDKSDRSSGIQNGSEGQVDATRDFIVDFSYGSEREIVHQTV
jgi:hypothetical protein